MKYDETIMLSGASTPGALQLPLISFNAIYDLDIGLIRLIQQQYLDESIFDKKFFDRPIMSIINDSYNRTEFNPLTMFSKTNDIELLDDYYNQFMEKRKKDIIDLCVRTGMEDLIKLYIDSKDIIVSIMYYDDIEKQELESCGLFDECKLFHYKSMPMYLLKNFSQFYVKDIRELQYISNIFGSKTYYISSFKPNFNTESMELKMDENIHNIIHKGINHCISIFDMYDEEILKRGYVEYERN